MYVIKKMRLNKFVPRPIVTNKELFIASGEMRGTIESKETSDCYNEPTVDGASKTKMLALASEIAKAAVAKHQSAGKSADLEAKNAKDY